MTRKVEKYCGEDDLSYDAGIDLDDEVSARELYAVLVENQEGS